MIIMLSLYLYIALGTLPEDPKYALELIGEILPKWLLAPVADLYLLIRLLIQKLF